MSVTSKGRKYVALVIVFCFLLSLAITLTINCFPLYHWELNHQDILTEVNLDKHQMMRNYWELMSYLNLPWKSTLVLSDFPVSVSGAQHFLEVKRLFLLCYAVLLITTVPAILYLRSLYQSNRLWLLIQPFKIAAMLPIFLGVSMFVGFDRFFTLFHEILFANDDWLFNPYTDPIILALPAEFFFHCFVLAFLLVELFLLAGMWFGKRQWCQTRHAQKIESSL